MSCECRWIDRLSTDHLVDQQRVYPSLTSARAHAAVLAHEGTHDEANGLIKKE
jgi:hypothetical protein